MLQNKFYRIFFSVSLGMVVALSFSSVTQAALLSYTEDFESLNLSSSTALSDAGFVVYSDTYADQELTLLLRSKGTAPARNDYRAFSQVVSQKGSGAQGQQQLFVYSNYLSMDQRNSYVDALTLQQQIIGADDLGSTWTFAFDARHGDITGTSSASAWIRAIDDGVTLGDSFLDTTKLGIDWGRYAVSLYIDTSWEGKTLEFGVKSAATGYTMSGVYYDNFTLTGTSSLEASAVPIPASLWLFVSGLVGLIGMSRHY